MPPIRRFALIVFSLVGGLLLWLGIPQHTSPTQNPDMMAALQPLRFLTVAPRVKHTATVIFVHGLGDTGAGWRPVADMFAKDPKLHHVKWILPHAPTKPITANGGMSMPAWFDVYEFGNINAQEDVKGILESVHSLNQLITAEVDDGIAANRIVLGGFSQGGAMSLITGLTTERRLAGLVVLSGWLPIRNQAKAMASEHVKKLPIFWGHGVDDPVVHFDTATLSHESLKANLGIKLVEPDAVLQGGIEFHSYEDLPHSASQEELDELQTFLKTVIPEHK